MKHLSNSAEGAELPKSHMADACDAVLTVFEKIGRLSHEEALKHLTEDEIAGCWCRVDRMPPDLDRQVSFETFVRWTAMEKIVPLETLYGRRD